MTEALDYTGERMVPEKADPYTFWEHIYRYRFAAQFVKGKSVLDIACGEGYGAAALLKAGAKSVIGIDVSPDACLHAHKKYGVDARVGDAQNIPLENASVDVVVSFETIEHVSQPSQFLDECARVLTPGGMMVVSTPNRDAYHKHTPHNPFHLKELNEAEFVGLLEARFKRTRIFTQRPEFAACWSPRSLSSERSFWWKMPSFGRLRWMLQLSCCREIADQKALNQARDFPIQAIVGGHGWLAHLANPFYIRRKAASTRELPLYVLAVASL
jgi:SAM-dependent methyltransferase